MNPDENNAGPRFEIALKGIPFVVDPKGGIKLAPESPDPKSNIRPTHFALGFEELSQISMFLYGLARNPQTAPLKEAAESLLSMVCHRKIGRAHV